MNVEAVREKLVAEIFYFGPSGRELLTRALELAESAHDGQFRKVGSAGKDERDPYIIHPMRVALVLLEEVNSREVQVIASAILHDVIEDTKGRITREKLEMSFGKEIADMVQLLSKPPKDGSLSPQQLEDYHRQVSTAPRAVRMVKCADRLDNMRDIIRLDNKEYQTRYLSETREAYLPLAKDTDEYFYSQLSEVSNRLEAMLQS